jgi:hypothetical protein
VPQYVAYSFVFKGRDRVSGISARDKAEWDLLTGELGREKGGL